MKRNIKRILYFALVIFILLLIYLIYKEYIKESFYRQFMDDSTGGFGINPSFINTNTQATISQLLAKKKINPTAPVNVKPAVYSNLPDLNMSSTWFKAFVNQNAAAQKIKDKLYVKDQNLWVKSEMSALWSSGSQNKGTAPYRLMMQADGNLVVYDSGNTPVWNASSNNRGNTPFRLTVQNDGNVAIYESGGSAIWATNTYTPGVSITIPPSNKDSCFSARNSPCPATLTSENGLYSLITQGDGNLVLYKNPVDHLIGHINDAHVGQVRMKDGTWLSIQDAFTLIVGPGQSEGFRFTPTSNPDDYYSYSNVFYPYTPLQHAIHTNNIEGFRYDFLGIGSLVSGAANTVAGGVTGLADKIASGVVTAADWTAARATDAADFVKNAANNVGSWATTIGGDALNWAKNAGNLIVHDLVSIGNAIGNFARNAMNDIIKTATEVVNAIANFFGDLPGLAKRFVDHAVDYITKKAETLAPQVWNKIQPVLGKIADLVTGGSLCQYIVSRKLPDPEGKLEAVQVVEPILSPVVSEVLTQFIKDMLEEAALASVVLAPLVPVLELIYPLVDPYIQPHLVPLFNKLAEVPFMQTVLTEMIDNSVAHLGDGSVCSYLNPPSDASDGDINSSWNGQSGVSDDWQ